MKLAFLPPESIKPRGWLQKQLAIQAAGLHGNLDRVWPDVADSKWLGGKHEGWERLPYFLDGFIPLSVLIDDEDKKSRAVSYIKKLLSCQDESGYFCPAGDEGKEPEDLWSQFLILKVLTVYADCFKDESVAPAIESGLKFLCSYYAERPMSGWAAARWFECIVPMLWLYERTHEEWLKDFARKLKALGTDYAALVPEWQTVNDDWSHFTHAVNIAMALKSEAVFCELTGEKIGGLAEKMLDMLFKKHGTAYCHFTGDECLSGLDPSQGSELCGVVEAMYSYEWLTAVTGELKWWDLAEKLAFNALPAALTADMWAHQYDQQVNQIASTDFPKSVFRTNGTQSNMFGLEPHFGCCTANFGQGFPKFAMSCYMRGADGALAALSPLAAEIDLDGNKIVCESEYPFRTKFYYTAQKDCTLCLRVAPGVTPACSLPHTVCGGWLKVRLPAGVRAEFEFGVKPRLVSRPEGRKCLYYGPLLFALPVKAAVKAVEYVKDGVERKFPYCDYDMVPVGEWRYAFSSLDFEVIELPYKQAFDREAPPLAVKAALAPVKWETVPGYGQVASPKAGDERCGENEKKLLVPYGATYLRVTEMALVGE